MEPREFLVRMKDYAEIAKFDSEAAHGMADDLMCEVLSLLGYHEGVEVFRSMDKWYA